MQDGCVFGRVLRVVCCARGTMGLGPRVGAALVQGFPGDTLSFRRLVQLEFS